MIIPFVIKIVIKNIPLIICYVIKINMKILILRSHIIKKWQHIPTEISDDLSNKLIMHQVDSIQ